MKITLTITGIFLLTFFASSQEQSDNMENNQFVPRGAAITELDSLKNVSKFEADEFYVGLLPNESIPAANQALNSSIDRLIEILRDQPTLDRILSEYKVGLASFEGVAEDTEDREKVCEYYDKIRQIIGFDSTNDILNDWLY